MQNKPVRTVVSSRFLISDAGESEIWFGQVTKKEKLMRATASVMTMVLAGCGTSLEAPLSQPATGRQSFFREGVYTGEAPCVSSGTHPDVPLAGDLIPYREFGPNGLPLLNGEEVEVGLTGRTGEFTTRVDEVNLLDGDLVVRMTITPVASSGSCNINRVDIYEPGPFDSILHRFSLWGSCTDGYNFFLDCNGTLVP